MSIPELDIDRCYPSHRLVVKYRRDESSAAFDIDVSGGNILAARKLHSRPKISYGHGSSDGDGDGGYYSLLLLDIDFPARAAAVASTGRSCVNWALLNICKSDRAAMKEVAAHPLSLSFSFLSS